MSAWQLLDYVTAVGENPFRRWYEEQDAEVQATLDAVVMHLRGVDDWIKPRLKAFRELKREHAGLGEIRFWPYGPLRKFRVAGIYKGASYEFIFLTGCEKQMGHYIPVDAFDLALAYKDDFNAGKGTLIEHI